jgi:hypothetical protein
MATLSRGETSGRGHYANWILTQGDPTGSSLSQPGAADRTVHLFGTFDGATVVVEGSNDETETSWATMHDVSGALLSFTAASIALVAENPLFIRSRSTGGGASQSVNVNITTKGAR